MDRGAWQVTFHGVVGVGHDLLTPPPPPPLDSPVNYIQCSVINRNVEEYEKECMYAYNWITLHQKLTWHCISTIFQLRKKNTHHSLGIFCDAAGKHTFGYLRNDFVVWSSWWFTSPQHLPPHPRLQMAGQDEPSPHPLPSETRLLGVPTLDPRDPWGWGGVGRWEYCKWTVYLWHIYTQFCLYLCRYAPAHENI